MAAESRDKCFDKIDDVNESLTAEGLGVPSSKEKENHDALQVVNMGNLQYKFYKK